MSTHKRSGDKAKSSGVVVGGPTHKRLHVSTKIILLCAALIVLIAVVIFGTVAIKDHLRPTNKKNDQTSTQNVEYQALGLSLNGKSTDAQNLLDSEIAKTNNKVQQGDYYEQKSQISQDSGDYVNGLKFAQKAESLNPTANSAQLIAQNAESLGNTSLALQYYQKELQRIGKPIVQGDNDALIAKIKSLGGSQ